MPIIDVLSINGLSTLLVLLASIASALVALFFVWEIVISRRQGNVQYWVLLAPIIAVILLTAGMLSSRLAAGIADEKRSLLTHNRELTATALSSSSALACLDNIAGEKIENACEQAVFVDAQSVARAAAYTGARLSLLREAFEFLKNNGDGEVRSIFDAIQHTVEIDRYGLAAFVLSNRDGCTVEHCYIYAMLNDPGPLKANLKAQVFEQYISRYAANWNKEPAKLPLTVTPESTSTLSNTPEPASKMPRPVDSHWDFPSAASIPPVSIMNGEPPQKSEPSQKESSNPPGALRGQTTDASPIPMPLKRPPSPAAVQTQVH